MGRRALTASASVSSYAMESSIAAHKLPVAVPTVPFEVKQSHDWCKRAHQNLSAVGQHKNNTEERWTPVGPGGKTSHQDTPNQVSISSADFPGNLLLLLGG